MTGWRQAVFVRQRRIDVIQRALSKILDEESWSPATPRRLRVGSADASSRGWTMIVPELANFFLDRGGTAAPRLCRLARELHCPAYEVDVRGAIATTLFEVDALGRMRCSGSPIVFLAGLGAAPDDDRDDGDARLTGLDVASEVVGFGLVSIADDLRARIAALDPGQPMVVADYLGALAGFPGWTRNGEHLIAIGATGDVIYEPPRIVAGTRRRVNGHAQVTAAALPETREASARTTPRGVLPSHDRRGRRPRSAARPRR
jgi:hypothetical protein